MDGLVVVASFSKEGEEKKGGNGKDLGSIGEELD